MGKSNINDLINIDYNTLVELQRKGNRDALESVVRKMTTVANRRIANLKTEPVGKYSPALMHLKENTGKDKFTTKGLKSADHNQLLKQFSNLREFLSAKTSTLRGWRKVRNAIAQRTGAKKLFGAEYKSERSAKIWRNRELRFWKLYNNLKDNYGGQLTQLDSDRIQALLSKVQTMRNMAKTDDDISMAMSVYIDKLYEAGGDALSSKQRNQFDASFLESLKTENGMEEIRIAYDELDL